MILHIKPGTTEETINNIAHAHKGIIIQETDSFPTRIVTSSSLKAPIEEKYETHITNCYPFDTDIQLASRKYLNKTRRIKVKNIEFGGDSNNTVLIGGPCSVESRELITQSAELMKSLGIGMLRGGCYKPRTSPYTFQGLGLEGLKLLAETRDKFNVAIVTEIRDATHADDVLEYADIAQIGAKSM